MAEQKAAALDTRIYGERRTSSTSEQAIRLLHQLAASSFGPGGRFKMIRANDQGALTVTTTSHRLFGALRMDHPVCRVIVELLGARQAHGADGGLSTVMLATGLLLRVEESGLPRRQAATLLHEKPSEALPLARFRPVDGRIHRCRRRPLQTWIRNIFLLLRLVLHQLLALPQCTLHILHALYTL